MCMERSREDLYLTSLFRLVLTLYITDSVVYDIQMSKFVNVMFKK